MGSGEMAGKIFFCFCGSQGSTCCTVFSIWGFIMLLILGIALQIQSVAMYEDIQSKVPQPPHGLREFDGVQKNVTLAYENAAKACFMSAAIYLVFIGFSGVMMFVNLMRSRAIKRSKQK